LTDARWLAHTKDACDAFKQLREHIKIVVKIVVNNVFVQLLNLSVRRPSWHNLPAFLESRLHLNFRRVVIVNVKN
jgi:hypothetical protein